MKDVLLKAALYGGLAVIGSYSYWLPYVRDKIRRRKQEQEITRLRESAIRRNAAFKQRQKATERPLPPSRTSSPYGVKNRPSPSTQQVVGSPSPDAVTKRITRPPAPKGVPPQLLWKLDELTKNKQTSQRLVNAVAFNHPGRSRTWCTEKAIADLERDRLR